MKIRLEIDKRNGKAFTIEIHDVGYDEIKEDLIIKKELYEKGILP